MAWKKVGSGAATLYSLHTNHLGSVVHVGDAGGARIDSGYAMYEPFGAFSSTPTGTNPSVTDRGFTGHRQNNTGSYNLGLIYMNARYYHPQLGRFVSPDSIVPEPANPQSHNRYAYAHNSPLNYTDPTGHCIPMICGAIIGAVGGAAISYGAQVVANISQNGLTVDALTNVNWAAVGGAAVAGAVGGATFGLLAAPVAAGGLGLGASFSGTVLSGAASGVAAGQAGQAAGNVLSARDIAEGLGNPSDVLLQAASGGLLAGAGYGINQLLSQRSTAQILQRLANEADAAVPGTGPVAGTLKHSAFKSLVDDLGRNDLHTEVTYLNGRVVTYGTRGAVRLDVVEGQLSMPTAVYDLKTGSASLSASRIRQIQGHLPSANIPIHEIRPQ